ncbi:SMI1/KNR4 family protein [Streptomyces sp. NPDC012508]|uniref:SMI1/KNR4 family protein n=1 Tax=Streptomyces sp. NPDC012508 TaxID=3364837 RepID=UPI003687F34D
MAAQIRADRHARPGRSAPRGRDTPPCDDRGTQRQDGRPWCTGRDAFPTSRPTSWAPDHVPFDFVMGIGHRDRALSLLESPYLVEEWGLPKDVVLISGDGHSWIGLDYRACGRHGEPSVAWFDADDDSGLTLAPDFRSFIEGLTSPGSPA